jgi:hypothetical protein
MGSPSAIPAGTLMAQLPAKFTGMVNVSYKYIAKGSSTFSPILKAVVGEVGVRSTS